MRKWDEFSLMLHFLPFAPFFFTSLRKRYMFLPVYLLLFSLSCSSGYFLSTGFFLSVSKMLKLPCSKSHSLTWFTPGVFHLSSLWCRTWSGHVKWLFYFLSSCLSLPSCKTNGLSSVFSCVGPSSFLKCFSPLMSTDTGLAWFSFNLCNSPLHQLLFFCLPLVLAFLKMALLSSPMFICSNSF